MKLFCRACNANHDESEFSVIRDGVKLKTAICAKAIARQNVVSNRKQRARKKGLYNGDR